MQRYQSSLRYFLGTDFVGRRSFGILGILYASLSTIYYHYNSLTTQPTHTPCQDPPMEM